MRKMVIRALKKSWTGSCWKEDRGTVLSRNNFRWQQQSMHLNYFWMSAWDVYNDWKCREISEWLQSCYAR